MKILPDVADLTDEYPHLVDPLELAAHGLPKNKRIVVLAPNQAVVLEAIPQAGSPKEIWCQRGFHFQCPEGEYEKMTMNPDSQYGFYKYVRLENSVDCLTNEIANLQRAGLSAPDAAPLFLGKSQFIPMRFFDGGNDLFEAMGADMSPGQLLEVIKSSVLCAREMLGRGIIQMDFQLRNVMAPSGQIVDLEAVVLRDEKGWYIRPRVQLDEDDIDTEDLERALQEELDELEEDLDAPGDCMEVDMENKRLKVKDPELFLVKTITDGFIKSIYAECRARTHELGDTMASYLETLETLRDALEDAGSLANVLETIDAVQNKRPQKAEPLGDMPPP